MDFKTKIDIFRKRFGMLDIYDEAEELSKFKTRILNIFEDIDYNVEEKDIIKFCTCFGKRVARGFQGGIELGQNIFNSLESEIDGKQFYLLIETIFMLNIKTKRDRYDVIYSKNLLYRDLKEAVDISKINVSVTLVDGEVIFHPRGEEKLDTVLIEEVFSFLNPESQRHFISALKFYSNNNKESFIRSAESIRRCTEEFLRFKLDNKKGLDNNRSDLLKRFKSDQITLEIRNIISQIFSYLDKYFNENSKHKDGDIGEAENEFLLYQSGLLMRYINKVI